jgi:hypothetical protein
MVRLPSFQYYKQQDPHFMKKTGMPPPLFLSALSKPPSKQPLPPLVVL